jgi:hypothetical protein
MNMGAREIRLMMIALNSGFLASDVINYYLRPAFWLGVAIALQTCCCYFWVSQKDDPTEL